MTADEIRGLIDYLPVDSPYCKSFATIESEKFNGLSNTWIAKLRRQEKVMQDPSVVWNFVCSFIREEKPLPEDCQTDLLLRIYCSRWFSARALAPPSHRRSPGTFLRRAVVAASSLGLADPGAPGQSVAPDGQSSKMEAKIALTPCDPALKLDQSA